MLRHLSAPLMICLSPPELAGLGLFRGRGRPDGERLAGGGTLGSLPAPRPPTAHTRMPACTHALTTGVAHGPGISRAQQPPRKGASHERP